jgi:hypothetical protein
MNWHIFFLSAFDYQGNYHKIRNKNKLIVLRNSFLRLCNWHKVGEGERKRKREKEEGEMEREGEKRWKIEYRR